MDIKEIVLKILEEELGSGYDYEKDNVLNVSGIDEEVNRNIVMRIEDECGIDILDKDAENLYTLKDILAYVEKKKTPEPKEEEKSTEPKPEVKSKIEDKPKVEEPKKEEK